MHEPICLEILFLTVSIWVSLFGISEIIVTNWDTKQRLFFYIAVGIVSVIVSHGQRETTVCSLL